MNDHQAAPGGAPEDRRHGEVGSEEVGSLGEEAVRLLGSLAGWAREHASDAGARSDDAEGRATDPRQHDGSGAGAVGGECSVCPVCRAVHAVRGLSPEVRSHLTAAATHLLQAGLAVLSTGPAHSAGPADSAEEPRPEPRPESRVEHIDLDAEWPEEREGG